VAVDYLTLHGRKIEVPFEVKAVLSTNLDPSDLGDEAFFRRIHNKVYIGACTDDQFDWILARVAEKRGWRSTPPPPRPAAQVARARGDGELRAYLPGVTCELRQAIISATRTWRPHVAQAPRWSTGCSTSTSPVVATPAVGGHEPVLPTPAPVEPSAAPAPPPFRSEASI
jgi:hypothetical protein